MRALRQFTLRKWKSAGRNSSGRITIFHRGGGSKRLHRRIDLQRSTPSMGIVERIEYDPNRSSRIALVRWIDGVQLGHQRKCNTVEEFAPQRKIPEPTTTTIRGPFSFSSLPGKVDQGKVASFSPELMAGYAAVGLPTGMPHSLKGPFTSKGAGSKKNCVKDVFFSALSSSKAKEQTALLSSGGSYGFPRIAVAGAKPAFFAPQMREKVEGKNMFSLSDIQKWQPDKNVSRYRNYPSSEVARQKFNWFPYPSLPRANQSSRRLFCSVATEAESKQVEESKFDAPKEVLIKDYNLPGYYFNTVASRVVSALYGWK